jgi:hypothetical protein
MTDQYNFVDSSILPGMLEASEKVLIDSNVASYGFAMIANGLTPIISKHPLDKITDEWDIKIAPAGWAFSIWGIIYTMLGGFVYNQNRNHAKMDSDVIYGQVGFMFSFNMIANALWLYLFSQDSAGFFALAMVDIVLMLISAISILNISTHNHLNNWTENVFFRGGMSIYGGWLTTATILNVCFLLKSLGVDHGDSNEANEIFWSKAVLSVAFVIYNSYAAIERNPLYGAVFIWVLTAIKSNLKGKEDLASLWSFVDVMKPLEIIADILIGAYSYYEYRVGTITHGLFF